VRKGEKNTTVPLDPDTFSFAVVSDTHYQQPQYTISDSFVQPFAQEINTTYPEVCFVAHVGDFAQNLHPPVPPYYETNLNFGLNDFTNQVKRPLLIARGGHDVKPVFKDIALPFISNELEKVTRVEKPLETVYYAFDYGNSHFIFLDDFFSGDNEAELLWLVNDLHETKHKETIKHTFVLSHNPIWRYDRPWDIKPFTKKLITLLAEYEIDALICGHIHQNNASVRLFNNKKIMQLMSCAKGHPGTEKEQSPVFHAASRNYECGFIPVEKVQTILLPEEDLCYHWAYAAGAPSTYYIVTVSGSNVNVKLCSPGQGIIREFHWEKPNVIVDIEEPEQPADGILSKDDFGQISEAKLYYSCWSNSWTEAPVVLNGTKIGNLKVTSPDARWWRDDFRNTLEIDPIFFSLIKPENEIIIKNPNKDVLGVAHCVLHVQTKNRRQFISSLAEYAYLSTNHISSDTSALRTRRFGAELRISTKEDIESIGLPDSRVLRKVNLGEDLYPIKLRFHVSTPRSQPSVFPGAEWEVRSPESQGVEAVKLAAALQYLASQCGDNGIRETVVIRNGYLIHEGSDSRIQHRTWSIGIGEWDWDTEGELDGMPIRFGGGNVVVSARQLARFGWLFLNRGQWNGRQLISEDWVREATTTQVSSTMPQYGATRTLHLDATDSHFSVEGAGVYGYNWYTNGIKANGARNLPDAPVSLYYRTGYNHNMLFVIPEWNMVIVRLGIDGNPKNRLGIWNRVIGMIGASLLDIGC